MHSRVEASGHMSNLPTPEHFARAIVTACHLAGDDPFDMAELRVPQCRARHYAFQALKQIFPEAPVAYIAFGVGCAGNPKYYATNSTNGMQRFVGGPHAGRRRHAFWKEDVFAKVAEAIAAVQVRQETMPPPMTTTADEPRVAPIKLGIETGRRVEPSRPFISERQAAAYRMLQQAAQNTATLPKK